MRSTTPITTAATAGAAASGARCRRRARPVAAASAWPALPCAALGLALLALALLCGARLADAQPQPQPLAVLKAVNRTTGTTDITRTARPLKVALRSDPFPAQPLKVVNRTTGTTGTARPLKEVQRDDGGLIRAPRNPPLPRADRNGGTTTSDVRHVGNGESLAPPAPPPPPFHFHIPSHSHSIRHPRAYAWSIPPLDHFSPRFCGPAPRSRDSRTPLPAVGHSVMTVCSWCTCTHSPHPPDAASW
jgi:hypothetical protein